MRSYTCSYSSNNTGFPYYSCRSRTGKQNRKACVSESSNSSPQKSACQLHFFFLLSKPHNGCNQYGKADDKGNHNRTVPPDELPCLSGRRCRGPGWHGSNPGCRRGKILFDRLESKGCRIRRGLGRSLDDQQRPAG